MARRRAGRPWQRLPHLQLCLQTATPASRTFLQIQAVFAKMERTLIRQRISEGIAATYARGRKGGCPRVMTSEKLRDAQHLMADQSRSIPAIYRKPGVTPANTLYHDLHTHRSLKMPGRRLLNTEVRAGEGNSAARSSGNMASADAQRIRAVV
jgi:hypothetical protein